MSRDPIHLRPTAQIAERVLLPGDPGRALLLAQELLDKPLMANHHRGLWGYTGRAADGELLTIQSTGMGGPSAAIVLEELCDLGVRRAVRVGTCGALAAGIELGTLLCVAEVLAADGTSRALGAGERVSPDPDLTALLAREADRTALVATSDLFYDPDRSREEAWRAAGAGAVEMEAATLCAVGARRGAAVGCLLVVSDVVEPRARLGDEELEVAAKRMGAAALAALA